VEHGSRRRAALPDRNASARAHAGPPLPLPLAPCAGSRVCPVLASLLAPSSLAVLVEAWMGMWKGAFLGSQQRDTESFDLLHLNAARTPKEKGRGEGEDNGKKKNKGFFFFFFKGTNLST